MSLQMSQFLDTLSRNPSTSALEESVDPDDESALHLDIENNNTQVPWFTIRLKVKNSLNDFIFPTLKQDLLCKLLITLCSILYSHITTNEASLLWATLISSTCLRICIPVLQEAHAGCFAGHFAFKKVDDCLRRYYWWKGMRADVHHFCRSCLVCVSRKGPGRSFWPPLTPIPVRGPFHHIGVDVLQLPMVIVMLCVLSTT